MGIPCDKFGMDQTPQSSQAKSMEIQLPPWVNAFEPIYFAWCEYNKSLSLSHVRPAKGWYR